MDKLERKWWKEGTVYQIYPRSFKDSNNDGIGDLNGITEKLGYVKALGADIIWLNPVYSSPNDDNGYDISDYRNIMAEFGTLADFDALLAKAHSLGIRIIMDLVVNHSSDEHAWFIESRKSKDNPYRDYYIWKDAKDGKEPTNWGACFGGSAWEYDETTDQYYLHCFSKKQPDLNWENEKVREEVYDLMRFWGDRGIDGFRMDVITMISKVQSYPDGKVIGEYGDASPYTNNGPRVHEFLKEMNKEAISHYDWLTVGEGAGAEVENALMYTGSDRNELNMLFMFEHMNVGKKEQANLFNPKPFTLSAYKQVFKKWQTGLDGRGWNSLYLENHDQTRSVSRYGNTSTVDLWEKSAKMLAATYLLMQGTAYIYEGQELGMVNYPFKTIEETRDIAAKNDYALLRRMGKSDEEAMEIIREITRDNSRTPMQWDASKYAGFSESMPWIAVNPSKDFINVEAEDADPDSVLNFYRKLIKLKRNSETLIYGHFELLEEEDEDLFIYRRYLNEEEYIIISNYSDKERNYGLNGDYKLQLSNYEKESDRIRPYETLVLKRA